MGVLKSHSELKALKEAGRITRAVLDALRAMTRPGVSTMTLETEANRLLAQNRSTAPFKAFEGFNHAICVSLNEEIVNGPPSRERRVQAGDVVSIATAAEFRGIHAKAARTFYVGESPEANPPEAVDRLLRGTEAAIAQAVARSAACPTLNDLLAEVPETARQYRLTVLAQLGGWGIGKKLHENPPVPNLPEALETIVPLQPGLCFTLMPMFSLGTATGHATHPDGWTLLTEDGTLSAHVADTLLMGESGLINITGA